MVTVRREPLRLWQSRQTDIHIWAAAIVVSRSHHLNLPCKVQHAEVITCAEQACNHNTPRVSTF